MTKYRHMLVSWESEVAKSAEQFVQAAADWVGSMDYLHENPFRFKKCVYAPGSSKGVLPCTRLMYVDTSDLPREQATGIPEYFRETLLKVDAEAHVLFYQVEGEPLGMRNYYATKEVDPISNNRCRAKITARFDLQSSVPPEPFTEMLQRVYRAVILGVGNKYPISS